MPNAPASSTTLVTIHTMRLCRSTKEAMRAHSPPLVLACWAWPAGLGAKGQ